MRIPISKNDRFKILNRDNHTCQYCGKKAPDVVLEIDHKVPVSKGGSNKHENLVTSCFDCNRGKGIASSAVPRLMANGTCGIDLIINSLVSCLRLSDHNAAMFREIFTSSYTSFQLVKLGEFADAIAESNGREGAFIKIIKLLFKEIQFKPNDDEE